MHWIVEDIYSMEIGKSVCNDVGNTPLGGLYWWSHTRYYYGRCWQQNGLIFYERILLRLGEFIQSITVTVEQQYMHSFLQTRISVGDFEVLSLEYDDIVYRRVEYVFTRWEAKHRSFRMSTYKQVSSPPILTQSAMFIFIQFFQPW